MLAIEVTHHDSTGEGRGQKSTTGWIAGSVSEACNRSHPPSFHRGGVGTEVDNPFGSPEVCPMLATEITHHGSTGGGGSFITTSEPFPLPGGDPGTIDTGPYIHTY